MFRMRDYPETIVINENIWTVKFVRGPIEDEDGRGRDTVGLCDPSDQTIYIKMGQTPEERLKTFLHELLHAIENEYGIEIPHSLVHKLEDPFAKFLIDNYLGDARYVAA